MIDLFISSGFHDYASPTSSLIALAIFLTLVAYFRIKNQFKYFEKFGLSTPKTIPFFGNLHHFIFTNPTVQRRLWRKQLGRCYGFFWNNQPRFVIGDARVIQQICTKDFDTFVNHSLDAFRNIYQDQFLIHLKDDKWRRIRNLLSPTFTINKLRTMYDLLLTCSNDFVINCQDYLAKGQLVDARELSDFYTMDAIATCCFGIKLARNSAGEDKSDSHLANNSRENFVREAKLVIRLDKWRIIVATFIPKWLIKLTGFQIYPDQYYDPLARRTEKIIKSRRNLDGKIHDFLQSLLDATIDTPEVANEEPTKLTDYEILCSSILFLVVGMETTGNLMASSIYCLAYHQEVQQTLYDEIESMAEVNEDGSISFDFDILNSAKYLDAFVSETLRYIPPIGSFDRVANRDYYIEPMNITIPKGTIIDLPWDSVMMDDKYFAEAEIFKPERFLPENKDTIIPGSYCPFGIGPRHCIGMRFALTDAKLGLAKLVLNYRFEPAPGYSFPPELDGHIAMTWIKQPIVKIMTR